MWSAFTCSTYASIMQDSTEQGRLFSAGYEAGRAFLAAVEGGTVSNDDLLATVPVGVSMRMAGPTTEFIIGRIYEAAVDHAYDRVAERETSTGLNQQAGAASGLFVQANCDLL